MDNDEIRKLIYTIKGWELPKEKKKYPTKIHRLLDKQSYEVFRFKIPAMDRKYYITDSGVVIWKAETGDKAAAGFDVAWMVNYPQYIICLENDAVSENKDDSKTTDITDVVRDLIKRVEKLEKTK